MSEEGTRSVLEQVVEGALAASPAEQFATVLGVVGVWLMMKRSLWAFPAGLVQVSIFGWLCFQGGLYSETALQVMFFGGLSYGWWHWTRGAAESGGELPVTRLSVRARWGWCAVALGLWALWGGLMAMIGATAAWVDAFVFSVGVVSQVLQARKTLENWLGWLVANCVATGLFWAQGYYWFAALYLVFVFMAAAGWREWCRAESGAGGLAPVGREGA